MMSQRTQSHVSTADTITSTHICITGDVLGFIDLLAEHNLFTPNFGAEKVVCALHDEFHVEERFIPPDTQINNHLSYCHTSKLNHTNKIEIVDTQLHPFVHIGDEEDCQSFIYLHDKDVQGRKEPYFNCFHEFYCVYILF
jgi:hypothetical protein